MLTNNSLTNLRQESNCKEIPQKKINPPLVHLHSHTSDSLGYNKNVVANTPPDEGIVQQPYHLHTFDSKHKRPVEDERPKISVPLPFHNVDSGVAYKQRLSPLPVHEPHVFQPQHVHCLE